MFKRWHGGFTTVPTWAAIFRTFRLVLCVCTLASSKKLRRYQVFGCDRTAYERDSLTGETSWFHYFPRDKEKQSRSMINVWYFSEVDIILSAINEDKWIIFYNHSNNIFITFETDVDINNINKIVIKYLEVYIFITFILKIIKL